jgi:hypothetical protein
MASRTVRRNDTGARDAALKKGEAAIAAPPQAEARLRQRIERLERELETEGLDGPRGVRAPAAPRRSETPPDRR